MKQARHAGRPELTMTTKYIPSHKLTAKEAAPFSVLNFLPALEFASTTHCNKDKLLDCVQRTCRWMTVWTAIHLYIWYYISTYLVEQQHTAGGHRLVLYLHISLKFAELLCEILCEFASVGATLRLAVIAQVSKLMMSHTPCSCAALEMIPEKTPYSNYYAAISSSLNLSRPGSAASPVALARVDHAEQKPLHKQAAAALCGKHFILLSIIAAFVRLLSSVIVVYAAALVASSAVQHLQNLWLLAIILMVSKCFKIAGSCTHCM